jgi:hypothetical protein
VLVEFLSDEQATYGRFTGEPSPAELGRFFFDDADRALADKRRRR